MVSTTANFILSNLVLQLDSQKNIVELYMDQSVKVRLDQRETRSVKTG